MKSLLVCNHSSARVGVVSRAVSMSFIVAAIMTTSMRDANAQRPVRLTGQSLRSIELVTQFPETAWVGEVIPFHVTATNRRDADVILELVGLARAGRTAFDVRIQTQSGTVVWRAIDPRKFADPPTVPGRRRLTTAIVGTDAARQLHPGAHLEWWTVWSQRDFEDRQLPPIGATRFVALHGDC
jgi:hypothetical protein